MVSVVPTWWPPQRQGKGAGHGARQCPGTWPKGPAAPSGGQRCPLQGSPGLRSLLPAQPRPYTSHSVSDRRAEGTQPRPPSPREGEGSGLPGSWSSPLTRDLLHAWGSLGALSTLPHSGTVGGSRCLWAAGGVV